MTTPDTSAVRAWARDNGYDVADRGRLPAEVTEAYLAAQGKGGSKAAAKPAAKKKAPAKAAAKPAAKKAAAKAPASQAPAPAPKPTAEPAAPKPAEKPADTPAAKPADEPGPTTDAARLAILGPEIAALTKRVEALEAALGKAGGKTPRFRRRS